MMSPPAAPSPAAEISPSELRLRFLDEVGQQTRSLVGAVEVMATTARMLGEHLNATRCAYADVDGDNDRFTIRNDWSAPGVPSSAGVYSLDLFGPQATSNLRNGRHLVVRDVDRELGDDGGGRMFNAIGIKAIICAGLVKHGRLVAMMAVHQATPRAWTDDEIQLVAEVVDRCWAHIERVRDAAALKEQDQRKDEFLATLAHELRNPLAPIRYALAILRRDPDPASSRNAKDVIDRQVTHMGRLIDDLLDVSRINQGLIRLDIHSHSLRAILEQAVEAARPALEEGKHSLALHLPGTDVYVRADEARMIQVVSNLLTNAAKYTPDGGKVRLSANVSGVEAVVEVEDDGIGIALEDQGRLFQLFTQLDHGSHRSKGGLGIGLSLVRTLVELQGGTVEVMSPGLGHGSTFTLRMPLSEADAPEHSPLAVPTVKNTARRVLVVEDNPDGRDMLVQLLEVCGHDVRSVGDGESALSLAATFLPDVILLDVGLPGISGYDVCRRLRESREASAATIVALTGWGSQEDRKATSEAGFDHHLTKPVELADLERVIASHQ
ncbi:MAG: response regulator [Comamonadaceae bacterium]|nr:MAG: response regulator [Comamonadaceae bacterium]